MTLPHRSAPPHRRAFRCRIPCSFALVVLAAWLAGCASVDLPRRPPAWASRAIWYQVFVERFRNGDPTNDPTIDEVRQAWPAGVPASWQVTRWTHDWYAQEPWAVESGADFYTTVHMRRYGGDLQGVLERLDYLEALGVTALYLNPINDSPSAHKYDARTYHHVDRHFGPDPAGDAELLATEDPSDPRTWVWTAADRLFLRLLAECHRRGMRVIVDYCWNHTGAAFWAWRDVRAKQARSRYAGWYEIERFDDPATPEDEFRYWGWSGAPELPEFRKILVSGGSATGAGEGDLPPAVKEHIFAVTARWLDPDGDGDPSDGVDGFRLAVADRVPLGFWRDYRRFVKTLHPEALLLGELGREELADRLFDPAPWLQGDALDAAMEYRWYEPGREFFGGAAGATPPAYAAALEALDAGLPRPAIEARMNVASSHDTPRLLTALANTGRDEFEAASPRENPEYSVARPDADTRARARLLRLAQFTWAGAPHIWYGEEAGMWGADDPDCRKPMLWEDLEYDDEAADPPGRAPADEAADSLGDARVPEPVAPGGDAVEAADPLDDARVPEPIAPGDDAVEEADPLDGARVPEPIAPGDDDDVEAADPLDGARVPEPVPPVAPDLEHLAFVRQLVALRKAESDLFAAGEVTFLTPAFRNDVFVYSRALGEREAIVVFNRSSIATQVLVPVRGEFPFRDPLGPPALRWPIGGKVLVTLAGLEGKLLLNDPAHEAPPTDAAPETRRGFPLRSTHAQP